MFFARPVCIWALLSAAALAGCDGDPVGPATELPPFRYEVVELSLPGDSIDIRGLHNDGTVLFNAWVDGRRASFLRGPEGSLQSIGEVVSWDINASKQVVGVGAGPNTLPFVWSDGEIRRIDLGSGHNIALAINDRGQILMSGWPGFGVLDGDRFRSYGEGGARDLNNAGEVLFVTMRDPASAKIHNGTEEFLLGGSKGTRLGSINEAGFGVFSSWSRGASPRAGWIASASEEHSLGTLFPNPAPPAEWSSGAGTLWETVPSDLNDLNEVVGKATRARGDWRGFIWLDGQIHDLTTLVAPAWIVDDAVQINNRGDIVAWVWRRFQPRRPVLLRRVPT